MRSIITAIVVVFISCCAQQARAQADNGLPVVGTGFFVSDSGHVLTNNHVVRDCRRVRIRPSDGSNLDAVVAASDNMNDLALLSSSARPLKAASFQKSVRLGDAAFVYGFPLSGLLSSTGNFTSGTITAMAGVGDDSRMLQISAPVQPGNSGGPLLSDTGAVIGVVTSKLNALKLVGVTQDIPQNVNFAIKSVVGITFLESNNVSVTEVSYASKQQPSDIAQAAKEISVKVLCAAGAESAPPYPPERGSKSSKSTTIKVTERGRSFLGAGYRTSDAATMTECATECEEESECAAFQFSESYALGANCSLYDESSGLDTVTSESKTIGLKVLPRGTADGASAESFRLKRLSDKAFDWTGEEAFTAAGLEECENFCIAIPSCAALTYFKDRKLCRPMKAPSTLRPNNLAVSGVKHRIED